MSAGIPATAPTPVRVIATAAIHARGRPEDSRSTRPNAPTAPAIAAEIDTAIQVTRTTRMRPTAEGSEMNPKMNHAHAAITTAPTSSAHQSHVGVPAALPDTPPPPALFPPALRAGAPED